MQINFAVLKVILTIVKRMTITAQNTNKFSKLKKLAIMSFKTKTKALNYLNEYFNTFSELISYSHEVTDSGVINKSHLVLLTNEELINVANDAAYDIKCQVSDYFN